MPIGVWARCSEMPIEVNEPTFREWGSAMTNHSEPTGATPTGETPSHWGWLRSRLPCVATVELDTWLSIELEELEERFADLVTTRSRGISFVADRDRTQS